MPKAIIIRPLRLGRLVALLGRLLMDGDVPDAGGALFLAAAAGGFLLHNFLPARIFIGDSGNLFLGFSVAALPMPEPGRGVSVVLASVLVPVAVTAVPILAAAPVAVDRARRGRSPAIGGRDHRGPTGWCSLASRSAARCSPCMS